MPKMAAHAKVSKSKQQAIQVALKARNPLEDALPFLCTLTSGKDSLDPTSDPPDAAEKPSQPVPTESTPSGLQPCVDRTKQLGHSPDENVLGSHMGNLPLEPSNSTQQHSKLHGSCHTASANDSAVSSPANGKKRLLENAETDAGIRALENEGIDSPPVVLHGSRDESLHAHDGNTLVSPGNEKRRLVLSERRTTAVNSENVETASPSAQPNGFCNGQSPHLSDGHTYLTEPPSFSKLRLRDTPQRQAFRERQGLCSTKPGDDTPVYNGGCGLDLKSAGDKAGNGFEEQLQRLLQPSGPCPVHYRWTDMTPHMRTWTLELCRSNMSAHYARVWGWNDARKKRELSAGVARFIVMHLNDSSKTPVAYTHYRFDMDEGQAVLYCYELQVEVAQQGKGLGRSLMVMLEAIAKHFKMKKVMLTVFKSNTPAYNFYRKLGYRIDDTSPQCTNPAQKVGYQIMSKALS